MLGLKGVGLVGSLIRFGFWFRQELWVFIFALICLGLIIRFDGFFVFLYGKNLYLQYFKWTCFIFKLIGEFNIWVCITLSL